MMAIRGRVRRVLPVLFCVLGVSAFAAEPSPGLLVRRCPWLRFEVAAGRIAVAHLSRAPSRTLTAEQEGSKESLALNPSGDDAGFSYRFAAADREWTLEYREPGGLTLSDRSGDDRLLLEQKPDRPIFLTLERSGFEKQTFAGRSLWHLLVFEPEARDLLLPHLALLHGSWGLDRQTREIEEHLFQAIATNWRDERSSWQQCLQNLASPDYQTRQTAERKLHAGGSAAVGFLQVADQSALTPEQLRRIASILEVAGQQRDEPAAIAAGWVYDTDVWCRLLGSEDSGHRASAAQHLTQLLGRPVTFDAAGEQQERAAQIKVIREKLIRR